MNIIHEVNNYRFCYEIYISIWEKPLRSELQLNILTSILITEHILNVNALCLEGGGNSWVYFSEFAKKLSFK